MERTIPAEILALARDQGRSLHYADDGGGGLVVTLGEPNESPAEPRRARDTSLAGSGWVSGWGRADLLGHQTYYGRARTEVIGGTAMVYLWTPDIEEGDWTNTEDEDEDDPSHRQNRVRASPDAECFFPVTSLHLWRPLPEGKVRLALTRHEYRCAPDLEPAVELEPNPTPEDDSLPF